MTTTTDPAALRVRLVQQLSQTGYLTDPALRRTFAAVPRHEFAGAVYRIDEHGQVGDVLHSDLTAEREEYLEAVYSDDAIVTQVTGDGRVTSSSTQPGVMAVMLEALRLRGGETVLEIGTGTGYNAALLSHRLGDRRVSSVDIDPGLVDQAHAALARAGYRPHLAEADGLAGYPRRAPYDRIIATCSVRRVPAAWLEQVRPGGIVMANMSYGVVPLRVDADGTGRGRFLTQVASFIEARPADGPPGPTTEQIIETVMGGTGSASTAGAELGGWVDPRFEFFARLHEPSIYQCTLLPDGEEIHCLVDADTGAWARVHQRANEATVVQGGTRRLWDDVADIYRQWVAAGAPDHDALYLMVDAAAGRHDLSCEHDGRMHTWRLR